MLPSWRKRLYIAVGQSRISMLMLNRGLKGNLLASNDEVIEPVGTQLFWQTVSDRLSQLLAQPEWCDADVHIVLSNRLVRYAVIPSNTLLKSYAEQEAFAKYSLTQIYGIAAEQWSLRIQHGKPSAPWLVSAVDQLLLDRLRHACATKKFKLHSITPYLMSVFNHYRNSIKADPAWLVINEPGYSLFTLWCGGDCISLNGICHDSLSELPLLLDRENLACSLPESCNTVYLHAPACRNFSTVQKTKYEFNLLGRAVPDDFPSSSDGLYAIALSGAL